MALQCVLCSELESHLCKPKDSSYNNFMDLWDFYEQKMERGTDQGEADQDEQLPLDLR